ncbi:YqcI/YcgG family protein [Tumebacillus sp. ITR2]|uniref:YqcI/YcgG family protein n=1 Tax=Tumebacillus amylolyticus TaxID=2801339 RepID=A0ABS1J8F1_9BACL|nr:YqcI/YcgG family protein [Tumebacillus amylolyticus]MBL0386553.1 YqcI/YcgG family protein [Tumebacillus amylolyticus]
MERVSTDKLQHHDTHNKNLFRRNDIEQQGANIPEWGRDVYDALKHDLLSEESPFPCVFGVEGFKKDLLCYSFFEDAYNEHDLLNLRDALVEYTRMFRELGRNTSFVAFFKPSEEELAMEEYQSLFWSVLRFLNAHDPQAWPADIPQDTEDPLWEFCFNGEPIFVVCNTPAHEKRKSRSAKTFLMTFQPRWVFEELHGEKGEKGRALVRQRLAKYDEVEVHPAMGVYGSEANREWKQYFITDENTSPSKCPFHALFGDKK